MHLEKHKKRVFFALNALSPWQLNEPPGKNLDFDCRHITTVFIGEVLEKDLKTLIQYCPKPSFSLGIAGTFDSILLLPQHRPTAICYHLHWVSLIEPYLYYRNTLIDFLQNSSFIQKPEKKYLPHVTVSRSAKNVQAWKEYFRPIPCISTKFCLYQSLGNSQYQPLWEHPFTPPFTIQELQDGVKYIAKGTTLNELYDHILCALAFSLPQVTHTLFQNDPPVFSQVRDIMAYLEHTLFNLEHNEKYLHNKITFEQILYTKESSLFEIQFHVKF